MTGHKYRDRSLFVVTILFAIAAVLIGCGGGGGGGGSTTATASATGSGGTTATTGGAAPTSLDFSLQWPASTRSLPGYANCVVLNIQRGSDNPLQQTIN